jgi:FAD/FMN-containing dehydrogenase
MIAKELASLLPAHRLLSTPSELATYGKDWISDYSPAPSCVALPETEAEVQAILKYCNDNNIAVVPSGGRTGLSGGATAVAGEVVISLERLNSYIQINQLEQTITVDAGVLTEKVQQVALENNLYFPTSISRSYGTAQANGNPSSVKCRR